MDKLKNQKLSWKLLFFIRCVPNYLIIQNYEVTKKRRILFFFIMSYMIKFFLVILSLRQKHICTGNNYHK